jgi:anti-sigma regulatory factor (Ser/Thr protein kinase)
VRTPPVGYSRDHVTTECFPFDPASVANARRWVASEASGTDVDVAMLLVTELATNAVLHARSPFAVTVEAGDDHVTLGVSDQSPSLPRLSIPEADDVRGRGLYLVAELALRWGVEPTDDGKRVWFDLPRR